MCRLAAYIGPDILLEQLMLQPSYGLVQQSWAPREMKEGKLNADGYGFGWFAADGKPAMYTNPAPIWTDPNLPHLGRTLSADLWLASVRSATRYTDINYANTQPFADEKIIFMHNGYIKDFPTSLRPRIRKLLLPQIEAAVEGNTDSEYLFALLRQHLLEQKVSDLSEGIQSLLALLTGWLGDTKALLNFIISDGTRIIATRHSINGECPSLYYTVDENDYPGGMLIASEPLTESASWQPIPEHQLVIMARDQAPQFIAL